MHNLKTELLKAEQAFNDACTRCDSLPYGSPEWLVALDAMSKALDTANRAEEAFNEAITNARKVARNLACLN